MQISHHREFSPALNRDMEFKVYGHGGQPMLWFPCQDGRFFDLENFGVIEALRPWIEAGRLQVFTLDTVDRESWSDLGGDPGHRIWVQECYHRHVVDEIAPRALAWSGQGQSSLWVGGISLGGLHAAISFFRRPDLFSTMVSLSGVFDARLFFGDEFSAMVYDNSPRDFVADMPDDHPWLDRYRNSKIVVGVGQGAWEDEVLPSTRWMDATLTDRGIPHWFDYWGFDSTHDWPWWHKMVAHFMHHLMPW